MKKILSTFLVMLMLLQQTGSVTAATVDGVTPDPSQFGGGVDRCDVALEYLPGDAASVRRKLVCYLDLVPTRVAVH